jgi:hypothetical protein
VARLEGLKSLLQNPVAVQKLLLWLVISGLVLLLVEIRFEHKTVLAEKWQAWIPCGYLMMMAIVGPLSMLFFRKFGRIILVVCFAGLAIVGSLGFWFHSKGKPVEKVSTILATDLKEPGHLEADDDQVAPVLAPLSLIGLGTIGLILSLWQAKNGARSE